MILHSLAVHLPILCHVSASQRLEIAPLDQSGSPNCSPGQASQAQAGEVLNTSLGTTAKMLRVKSCSVSVCCVWRCQNHSESASSTLVCSQQYGELCMTGTLQWLWMDLLPHPVWNLGFARPPLNWAWMAPKRLFLCCPHWFLLKMGFCSFIYITSIMKKDPLASCFATTIQDVSFDVFPICYYFVRWLVIGTALHPDYELALWLTLLTSNNLKMSKGILDCV